MLTFKEKSIFGDGMNLDGYTAISEGLKMWEPNLRGHMS